jgi:hypothetical protein
MANNFTSTAAALYNCDSGSLNDSINSNNFTKNDPPTSQDTPAATAGQEGIGGIIWNKSLAGGGAGLYDYGRSDALLSSNFPGQSTNNATGWTMCAWLRLNWNTWEGDGNDDTIFGALQKGTHIGLRWFDETPATGDDYTLWAYVNGSITVLNSGAPLKNNRWYHIAMSLIDNGPNRTFTSRLWDDTASAYIKALDSTSNWGGSLTTNSNPLVWESTITGQGAGSANSHSDSWDEIVFLDSRLTPAELIEVRTGTFGGGGGSPPPVVPDPDPTIDDLPVWPAARPVDYDPDLFWQPGTWEWSSDFVTTGGGRWGQQLFVLGNDQLYYEALT